VLQSRGAWASRIAIIITITVTIITIMTISDRRRAALRGFFRVTLAAGVRHVSFRNHSGRPLDPAALRRTGGRQRRPLLGIRLRIWPRRSRLAWHHPDCPHRPVAYGPPIGARAGIARGIRLLR